MSDSNQKSDVEPKWKSFERLVAAIHMAEMKGAKVTWNEIIDGRQFDVTIRFETGFYEYLTLIECKDCKTPISVEKVEAFATKAKRYSADKAIMVSANGFQSGAIEAAKQEKIQLFTLRQEDEISDDWITDKFFSFVAIRPIGFRKTGQDKLLLLGPSLDQMIFQLANIKLTTFGDLTLERIIRPFVQLISPVPLLGVPETNFKRANNIPQQMQWGLPIFTRLIFPGKKEEMPVSHFIFFYWEEKAQLSDSKGIDPTIFSLFARQITYKDELTGKVRVIDGMKLPLGIDTKFEEGKYYYNPRFRGFSYFCEKIEKDEVALLLLESFQHGKMMRGEMKETISTAIDYIEVTTKTDLIRLEQLLKEFIVLRENVPPTTILSNMKGWIT